MTLLQNHLLIYRFISTVRILGLFNFVAAIVGIVQAFFMILIFGFTPEIILGLFFFLICLASEIAYRQSTSSKESLADSSNNLLAAISRIPFLFLAICIFYGLYIDGGLKFIEIFNEYTVTLFILISVNLPPALLHLYIYFLQKKTLDKTSI